MIYLKSFALPTDAREELYFNENPLINPDPDVIRKNKRWVYTTKYPFDVFYGQDVPRFDFSEITIFCGGNGSGKSTILNLIADKLRLERGVEYNRSDFFEDYLKLCQSETCSDAGDYRNLLQRSDEIPAGSRIITSDDVFNSMISKRRLNQGIDEVRAEMIKEYIYERENGDVNLHSLDDYDRWLNTKSTKTKRNSQSRYLSQHLIKNVPEQSNGESALAFFVNSISENALYLLDEPENSLSPSKQLELKYFLEDSAQSYGCQFIISTHSPFVMSLRHARIYNLDENPVVTRKWEELECVRVYYDFFREHADEFED